MKQKIAGKFFRTQSDSDVERAVKARHRKKLQKRGERLYSEGDEPEALWLMQEGRVHMTKTSPGGGESLVGTLYTGRPDFCIAAAIIHGALSLPGHGSHYRCRRHFHTQCQL